MHSGRRSWAGGAAHFLFPFNRRHQGAPCRNGTFIRQQFCRRHLCVRRTAGRTKCRAQHGHQSCGPPQTSWIAPQAWGRICSTFGRTPTKGLAPIPSKISVIEPDIHVGSAGTQVWSTKHSSGPTEVGPFLPQVVQCLLLLERQPKQQGSYSLLRFAEVLPRSVSSEDPAVNRTM